MLTNKYNQSEIACDFLGLLERRESVGKVREDVAWLWRSLSPPPFPFCIPDLFVVGL